MVAVLSNIHAGLRLANLDVKFTDGVADVPENVLSDVLKFGYLGVELASNVIDVEDESGNVPNATDSDDDETVNVTDIEPERPRGNSSLEDWVEYADLIGVPIPDDATRNQIRDLFED